VDICGGNPILLQSRIWLCCPWSWGNVAAELSPKPWDLYAEWFFLPIGWHDTAHPYLLPLSGL
jgi:hypothetical protein